MTLLDFPGKVACTVFLGGCNFRCPFCHNAGLVLGSNPESYTEEEILSYLEKRKGLLDGVCFTGGEPTLRGDLLPFIEKVKALGFAVKLDTNGTNPALLKELLDRELVDYVAMDIKNSPARYAETVGVKAFNLSEIYKSIDILKSSGVEYEFRTTVTKTFHDEKSLLEASEMIEGATVWYLQTFRESENLIDSTVKGYTEEEMQSLFEKLKESAPFVKLR